MVSLAVPAVLEPREVMLMIMIYLILVTIAKMTYNETKFLSIYYNAELFITRMLGLNLKNMDSFY